MSTYITGYDNPEHDRYTEVEIDFELEKGGREYPLGIRHASTYYDVPSEIAVNAVRVLYVEFYNPHGDTVAVVQRANIQPIVLEHEDADAKAVIENQLDGDDCFFELLAENAG